MPYYLEVCRAGKTIEFCKYHSYKYPCKGEKRGKRVKTTCETQEKINLRRAEKNLRRLMNHNFCDDDFLITLDYFKKERPEDSKGMQADISNFLRKLRRIYKKENEVLKYIYTKEIGPRGAAHVHMMISRCGDKNLAAILKDCWSKGGVHVDALWSDGQYAQIAAYFVKYANKTIETEGELVGKKYYPSRNLKRPKVTKKIIQGVNTYYEKVKEKAGYYLEKDSVVSGQTVGGYGYFSYTLHEIKKKRKRE
jgi:hypothetical protein